jgi:hypothetical protein
MKRAPEHEKAPRLAGRRRFLIWNAAALLFALAGRIPGIRLLPGGRGALRGHEARWYRKIR